MSFEEYISEESQFTVQPIGDTFCNVLEGLELKDIDFELGKWMNEYGEHTAVIWKHCSVIFCDDDFDPQEIDENSTIMSSTQLKELSNLYDYLLFIKWVIYDKRLYIFGSITHSKWKDICMSGSDLKFRDIDETFSLKYFEKIVHYLQDISPYYNTTNGAISFEDMDKKTFFDDKTICEAGSLFRNCIFPLEKLYLEKELHMLQNEIESLECAIAIYPNNEILKQELETLRFHDDKLRLQIDSKRTGAIKIWDESISSDVFYLHMCLCAANQEYQLLFFERERVKLENTIDDLLNQPESLLSSFIARWFNGLLGVRKCLISKYPNNYKYTVDPFFKENSNSEDKKTLYSFYVRVQTFHLKHYPSFPLPTVFYTGPSEYLQEYCLSSFCPICKNTTCNVRLLDKSGQVLFTRQELKTFIMNYFEKWFGKTLVEIQLQTNVQHLPKWKKVVTPQKDPSRCVYKASKMNQLLKKNHQLKTSKDVKLIRELASSGLAIYDFLKPHSLLGLSASILTRTNYTEEFISESELCLSDFSQEMKFYITRVIRPNNLMAYAHLSQNLQVNSSVTKTSCRETQLTKYMYSIRFESLSGIKNHIETYWPPCMVNIVETSKGSNHPKHLTRLKLSTFIYNLGYERDTAYQIGYYIFVNTNIVKTKKLTLELFYGTKQGRDLAYEYTKKNSIISSGLSCITLASAGKCPFGSKNIADIEDILEKKTAMKEPQFKCSNYRKKKSDPQEFVDRHIRHPFDYPSAIVDTNFAYSCIKQ